MSPSSLTDAVRFLDAVDQDDPKLVVRWADESRLQADGQGAYSVRPISYAILTARIDGRAHTERFDEIDLDALKAAIAARPLLPLYRSDNLTR